MVTCITYVTILSFQPSVVVPCLLCECVCVHHMCVCARHMCDVTLCSKMNDSSFLSWQPTWSSWVLNFKLLVSSVLRSWFQRTKIQTFTRGFPVLFVMVGYTQREIVSKLVSGGIWWDSSADFRHGIKARKVDTCHISGKTQKSGKQWKENKTYRVYYSGLCPTTGEQKQTASFLNVTVENKEWR